MAVTGHITRSMIHRYNIVSEGDLRMASQKTALYVDTLPTTREAVKRLLAYRRHIDRS
jgi:hypothetical protein